jgi:hypothetical protein
MKTLLQLFESTNDPDWTDFEQVITHAIAVYGSIHPDYLTHAKKQYADMNAEQRKQWIKEHEESTAREAKHREVVKQNDAWAAQFKKKDLVTKNGKYPRVDYSSSRIVCSSNDPKFEKRGMPAFESDLISHDPELKGYYSIHVGNPNQWLGIMARDGYCDDDAYVYSLDLGALYYTKMPYYEVEDYHIMDKTNLSGTIVFSKRKIVPAQIITLKKVIPFRDIKIAPDPY